MTVTAPAGLSVSSRADALTGEGYTGKLSLCSYVFVWAEVI